MMDCIVSALGSYSQTGADSGYITEINGPDRPVTADRLPAGWEP